MAAKVSTHTNAAARLHKACSLFRRVQRDVPANTAAVAGGWRGKQEALIDFLAGMG